MKLKNLFLTLFVISTSITQSCVFCGLDYVYTKEPIYISLNEIKDDISFTEDKKIDKTGKIYLYKNYIFINESNFGVHIIDNTDSKNPKKFGFIKIPFNQDISIKNDILYANSFGELISIDISDIKHPKVIEKIKVPEYIDSSTFNIDQNRVQVGYKRTGPFYRYQCPEINLLPAGPIVSTPSTIGQSGSLAKFAIANDYLYTVSSQDLHLFDIKDPKKIVDYGKVNVALSEQARIETIFPYEDKIFMGSTTGAYIYDNKNPQQPTFITKVEHIKSCDPVVVEGTKAYVTLSSGETCRSGNNELDIVDLSDITNSYIIKTYPMTHPSGLAIKSNNLFICDGTDGLKIFDTKDPFNIKQKAKININEPMDIILNDNYQGIVTTEDGIYQYDFSGLPDKTDFKQLSYIPLERDRYFNNVNEKDNIVKEGNNYYYKWYKEYLQNKS